MSAGEWAAVAVAGVAAVAVVGLVVTMATLLRTLGALQQTIDTLRAETIPLVTDVQKTARRACKRRPSAHLRRGRRRR